MPTQMTSSSRGVVGEAVQPTIGMRVVIFERVRAVVSVDEEIFAQYDCSRCEGSHKNQGQS